MVFTRRQRIVHVHGCFWHQHEDPTCPLAARPRSNTGYWSVKLARNVERDREQAAAHSAAGWTALTVWECECADEAALAARLVTFLGPPRV